MSTIHCPNCGSQLSQDVSFCGNCGNKITVCPECQSVNSGTSNMCSNCGFAFTNTNANHYNHNMNYNNYSNSYSPQQNPQPHTTKDLLMAKKQQSPLGNLLHSETLSKVLIFGFIACLAIIGIRIFVWHISGDLVEKYLEMESFVSLVKSLLIIALCLNLLFKTYYDGLIYVLFHKNLTEWIDINHVNLISAIDNTFNLELDKMPLRETVKYMDSLDISIYNATFRNNFILQAKILRWHWIKFISSIIAHVFSYLFLFENFKIYCTAEIFKSDLLGMDGFSFSMIENYWMLAVVVVLIVINSIIDSKISNNIDEAKKQWVATNLPHHSGRFRKYVLNAVEYEMRRESRKN